MVLFDTVGTLVGVANRAGLMVDGRLPKAQAALTADAAGTVFGGVLGTSTVTSFIESVTGVTAGARTGLSAIVTGLCLLAALLFQPLVEMIGSGVNVAPAGGPPVVRYPMIAPALILVGSMMMRAVKEVDWDDLTEGLPAFLAMVSIPFTFSIATGIAVGFISYACGKVVTGRPRQCPAIVYVFAVLFVVQYLMGILSHAIR
jgi:AGZA family xanthine/uracil permease-like MFS transporter